MKIVSSTRRTMAKLLQPERKRRTASVRLQLEPLEHRITPANSTDFVLAAADAGGTPVVTLWDQHATNFYTSWFAFPQSFTGGVRVAPMVDLNNDGFPDIIVAQGPGSTGGIGSAVSVFNGADCAGGGIPHPPSLLSTFYPYNNTTTGQPWEGGIFVTVGNVDGLGPEIITGADAGGGPHVEAWHPTLGGSDGHRITGWRLVDSFMAYDVNFAGGVRVAALPGTQRDYIVTAPGPGGGPDIRVFNNQATFDLQGPGIVSEFYAYEAGFTGGVYVATTPSSQIITGPGAGRQTDVNVFTSTGSSLVYSLPAVYGSFQGGVRVNFVPNADSVPHPEIVVGPGPGVVNGAAPPIKLWDTVTHQVSTAPQPDPQKLLGGFQGGAFVAGGFFMPQITPTGTTINSRLAVTAFDPSSVFSTQLGTGAASQPASGIATQPPSAFDAQSSLLGGNATFARPAAVLADRVSDFDEFWAQLAFGADVLSG